MHQLRQEFSHSTIVQMGGKLGFEFRELAEMVVERSFRYPSGLAQRVNA